MADDVNKSGTFKVKLTQDVRRLGKKVTKGSEVENLTYHEALSLHAAGFANKPVEQKASEPTAPAK